MCDVHNLDCFKGVFSPLNQTDTVLSLRRKNQICWQIVFRYERVSDISLITLLVYYYTVGVSVQSQIVIILLSFIIQELSRPLQPVHAAARLVSSPALHRVAVSRQRSVATGSPTV